MLNIDRVGKSFGRRLLQDASMAIDAGTGAAVSAPNGSGKSTLLKMIVGVLAPDAGRITLDGSPASRQRHRFGYAPSGGSGFYPRLSVRQNLHYFGALHGLSARKVNERLAGDGNLFGIDYLDEPAERLSDGMLQKAKLTRLFLHEPDFLVLDEPLNFLDAASRASFMERLLSWRAAPGKRRAYVIAQHADELPDEHRWRIEGQRLLEGPR